MYRYITGHISGSALAWLFSNVLTLPYTHKFKNEHIAVWSLSLTNLVVLVTFPNRVRHQHHYDNLQTKAPSTLRIGSELRVSCSRFDTGDLSPLEVCSAYAIASLWQTFGLNVLAVLLKKLVAHQCHPHCNFRKVRATENETNLLIIP